MVSESPGRNESERRSGPENEKPRGPSPQPEGEGSTAGRRLDDAVDRSGGVCSDGTEARTRWKLEKPSSPRREIVGAKVGRITGNPGKSAEGERVAEGLVVALKWGNARGAKRPCCRAVPLTARKAGAR